MSKELNRFQSSDIGKLQGRDDYTNTRRVSEILRTQSDLMHKMEDYETDHHGKTDMSDTWGNASTGLGLGL